MATINLGEISKKLYDLLADLEQDDRQRVMSSVLALFGEAPRLAPLASMGMRSANTDFDEGIGSAKDFFSQKNPESRGETLAVAARFLELSAGKEVVGRVDIEQVFKDARRNFDSNNFVRDMKNAIHNAKLFLPGGERDSYKLSFFGQEYVDALPDKEKVRLIKRPGNSKKKAVKKVTEE